MVNTSIYGLYIFICLYKYIHIYVIIDLHVHCQSSCSSLSYLKFEINITKLFYTGVFGNFRLVGDAGDLSVLISGSVCYHCYHKK